MLDPTDPFQANPYAAPIIQDDLLVPTREEKTLLRLSSWLGLAVVIPLAGTLFLLTIIESSPRYNGIRIYPVIHLTLGVLFATLVSAMIARRSRRFEAVIAAQAANILIWLSIIIPIHVKFVLRPATDGWLFLAFYLVSAMLSLFASLVSQRRYPSTL